MEKKLTLQNLLDIIKTYDPDAVDMVTKAYNYAEDLHAGTFRQSGEPYITHPLEVAYILQRCMPIEIRSVRVFCMIYAKIQRLVWKIYVLILMKRLRI